MSYTEMMQLKRPSYFMTVDTEESEDQTNKAELLKHFLVWEAYLGHRHKGCYKISLFTTAFKRLFLK